MEIIKSECEQRGIKVWSETEVNANSLQADEIKTNSDCDNLGIHIDEIKMTGEKIIIAYSSLNSGDSVHVVSMEQWGQTGSISHKVTGSVTHVKRSDSTSIVDINVGTQLDSREIKRKLKTWEQKAKLIAAILSSDD